jgi:Fe-S-cluster containining protein
MYKDIKTLDKKIYFSNCENCTACCDGTRFSLAPLILDDFELVYQYFPILFGYIDGNLKALIVMQDNQKCKYLENGKCSIYDSRPPACQMYPFSPLYEDIFIDSECKAINEECCTTITQNGFFSSEFYHKRVDNFVQKLDNTAEFLDNIKDDLIYHQTVSGIELYKYDGLISNNYIDFHKISL